MKPIIGIVGRCQNNDGCSLIATNDIVRNAIIKSGGIPILILPTQMVEYDNIEPDELSKMNAVEKKDLIEQLKICDGILLPGGSKIFEYDKVICKYAIENDVPILGICLGMQIMSCYDKEDSLKRIESDINHNQKGINYVHEIVTRPNTILNEILGDNREVNSRHNECITTSSHYIVSAISEDNIIEAIEYPFNTFNIGVQWHPESMINYDEIQFNLIKEFIYFSKKKLVLKNKN